MALYEGELFKRGQWNNSWKQRWFVLTKDFKLEYYKTHSKYQESHIAKNTKNMLGAIDLFQIERIEVSKIEPIQPSSLPTYINILSDHTNHTDSKSFLINLKTKNRTYKLSANERISFIEWIQYLHTLLYDGTIMQSFLDIKTDSNPLSGPFYFVLNTSKHLKYYNNEQRDILLGHFNLKDPSTTVHMHSTDKSIHLTIGKRKKRKYTVLYTKRSQIFQEWSNHLKKKKHKSVNDYDSDTLYLRGMHLDIMPSSLFPNARSIKTMILTNNNLSSLKELELFPNLVTLQLDRNGLEHINDLPQLNKLTTLWLNNNNIHDLNSLLLTLKQKCPKLEYLSLLFNPICSTHDEVEYKRYRLTLIYQLPGLKYLDSERVGSKERHEAMYGLDDDVNEHKQDTASSSLFRPESANSTLINLEQHEEALKKQMTHLVQKLNYRLSQ